jgi:hypothetical protein
MGNPLEEDYTPESRAAEQLHQTIRTLRKWRQVGLGPPWIKVGKRIHYSNAGMARLAEKPRASARPIASRRLNARTPPYRSGARIFG